MMKGAVMDQPTFDSLLAFFKALGDKSRLKIVGALANREYSVGELAETLELREPTVSHHLARLREVGLVCRRVDGTVHTYALQTTFLEQMSKQVFTAQGLATMDTPINPDAWRQKVLASFFEGEVLTSIPASRKKRQVILDWLAERFERERRYTEPEVNAILTRHHPDCATLRRELVGCDLMTRERGVYWRLPSAPAP